MIKRPLALIVISLLVHPVAAQQACTNVPGQRILYVRVVPTVVRNQMPAGAKSCFFGAFKLTATGPVLSVHLYNKNAKEELVPSYRRGKYHFTVDIFQIGQASNIREKHYRFPKRYRFLNSFDLSYQGTNWAPTRFSAQLLWLDPKQRKQPIIKFDCFSKGIYGPLGDNVLAIFPHGLTQEPTVQSFIFGLWRASDTSGAKNSFEGVDEKGLLQISQQFYLPTSEVPTPPPIVWKWNGKMFAYSGQ